MAKTLLDHYKSYLVTQGLVRDPDSAGSVPPIWRHPINGLKAPGEGSGTQVGPDSVVGLFHAGGFPAALLESAWRQDMMDVVIRARTAPIAVALHKDLRSVTLDRFNWRMGDPGGITIMQTQEMRPLQPLSPQTQFYTFIWGVVFQYYAVDA
jgi:hypothetical protein